MKSATLGLVMLAMTGGAAFAQSNSGMMSGDHMMASKSMSKADMKTMDKCKAMANDAMMKSSKCMKMMKMHPDMMKGDAMSGGMAPK